MKKSRIKFADLDTKLLEDIASTPEFLFDDLEELSVKIPSWSKLLLVVLSIEKKTLEIAFYEEAKEFFLSYTKKVLKYSKKDLTYICFSREESEYWKMFSPPTLIGTNLKTRLRKKREI